MNVNLAELAKEIHEAAVEKGFWDVEDAEAKHIAKMHSELSEAVQADRVGNMYEVEHEGAKPEGVAAELADFVMMVLDWASLHGTKFEKPEKDPIGTKDTLYSLANDLHEVIVDMKSQRVARMGLLVSVMIRYIEVWLEERGYDLWQIIRQKMEYNKSRPKLHGRAY